MEGITGWKQKQTDAPCRFCMAPAKARKSQGSAEQRPPTGRTDLHWKGVLEASGSTACGLLILHRHAEPQKPPSACGHRGRETQPGQMETCSTWMVYDGLPRLSADNIFNIDYTLKYLRNVRLNKIY